MCVQWVKRLRPEMKGQLFTACYVASEYMCFVSVIFDGGGVET